MAKPRSVGRATACLILHYVQAYSRTTTAHRGPRMLTFYHHRRATSSRKEPFFFIPSVRLPPFCSSDLGSRSSPPPHPLTPSPLYGACLGVYITKTVQHVLPLSTHANFVFAHARNSWALSA